jgi:hypothetical protein
LITGWLSNAQEVEVVAGFVMGAYRYASGVVFDLDG